MSDTWSSIQAHKKQLDSLRERLQRRRKQDPLDLSAPPRTSSPGPASSPSLLPSSAPPSLATPLPAGMGGASSGSGGGGGTGVAEVTFDPALERRLLLHLADLSLPLPTDAAAICDAIAAPAARPEVESLLQKFAAQELIEVKRGLLPEGPSQSTLVTYADHSKLSAMTGAVKERKRRAEQDGGGEDGGGGGDEEGGGGGGLGGLGGSASCGGGVGGLGGGEMAGKEALKKSRKQASDVDLEIESLLSQQSTKEQQSKKVSQEILELLNTTTAKEQSIVEKFRSRGRAQVQEFCDHGTKEECVKATGDERPCRKLHFRRIINKHTDESLGDCSFLNTCFHMDTCKYVHYEIDACPETPPRTPPHAHPRDHSPTQDLTRPPPPDTGADRLFPPQ
ncbi:N6-adenosine-methyltransferase catalytic subunit, partial [Calypte anna]|uniref:N6-adenosine-methyltransferase catalytic subunit n=1 Tax=Calypte anna TaxID=9244 RepID=UPI0011C36C79